MKSGNLYFTKTRTVKTPARGTSSSAGIDFYVPEDFIEVMLGPGDDVLIPSGIRVRIPGGCVLTAFNKSGIATKKKLIVGACVIDEDYTGEIHLHLINVGKGNVSIKANDKIAQFILSPVFYTEPEEINQESYESFGETSRGAGGFGSTDNAPTLSGVSGVCGYQGT